MTSGIRIVISCWSVSIFLIIVYIFIPKLSDFLLENEYDI